MAQGPSKEELENYWKSSRAYFDELAEHYRKTDPEYYRTHIQPFYSNPFAPARSHRPKGAAPKIIFVLVLMGALVMAGTVLFFFFAVERSQEIKDNPKEQKQIPEERVNPRGQEKNNANDKNKMEDEESLSAEDNFIIGSKALGDKDYDKAEKHFRKIKPGDKYYRESQELIESIKYLRKFDK